MRINENQNWHYNYHGSIPHNTAMATFLSNKKMGYREIFSFDRCGIKLGFQKSWLELKVMWISVSKEHYHINTSHVDSKRRNYLKLNPVETSSHLLLHPLKCSEVRSQSCSRKAEPWQLAGIQFQGHLNSGTSGRLKGSCWLTVSRWITLCAPAV